MSPTDTSDSTWQAIIEDFRRSGLTQAEFCSRRGLSLHSFRKRLYGRPGPTLAPLSAQAPPVADPISPVLPSFLPVTLVTESPAAALPETPPDPIVLILDARRRIAVAPGFDADTLRLLIQVIEARP
jgi:hypothetical protein